MPRKEHVISVFVASPGDVKDERARLEEVIDDINITWARRLAIRLELVRWETHTFPSMGADAQQVINSQIPDDYDIFIGIMWCRCGTPTPRYESGTIEEFYRAKARHDADSTSVQMMVYFKELAISPSDLDLDQFAKVKAFRQVLEKTGLYATFTDIENFTQLVRLHLIKQVQVFQDRLGMPDASPEKSQSGEILDAGSQEDEPGLLDLQDTIESRFGELSDIIERITKATEELGTRTKIRTDEIYSLPADSDGRKDRKLAKRLFLLSADDLARYSARMEVELPLYDKALKDGMAALIRSAELSNDFGPSEGSRRNRETTFASLLDMQRAIGEAKRQMSEFRQSIADLPRMIKELNSEKRRAVSVLDGLLAEYENTEMLISGALAAFSKDN